MIIDEVDVEGKLEDAMHGSFRQIAAYIFGYNTVQRDISITLPEKQQESQKILMTAPVQQQSNTRSW